MRTPQGDELDGWRLGVWIAGAIGVITAFALAMLQLFGVVDGLGAVVALLLLIGIGADHVARRNRKRGADS